jgi:hypothetical protein
MKNIIITLAILFTTLCVSAQSNHKSPYADMDILKLVHILSSLKNDDGSVNTVEVNQFITEMKYAKTCVYNEFVIYVLVPGQKKYTIHEFYAMYIAKPVKAKYPTSYVIQWEAAKDTKKSIDLCADYIAKQIKTFK